MASRPEFPAGARSPLRILLGPPLLRDPSPCPQDGPSGQIKVEAEMSGLNQPIGWGPGGAFEGTQSPAPSLILKGSACPSPRERLSICSPPSPLSIFCVPTCPRGRGQSPRTSAQPGEGSEPWPCLQAGETAGPTLALAQAPSHLHCVPSSGGQPASSTRLPLGRRQVTPLRSPATYATSPRAPSPALPLCCPQNLVVLRDPVTAHHCPSGGQGQRAASPW